MNAKLKVAILERFRFQADFAQAVGIPEDRLSRIIWRRREPSEDEVRRITCILKICPEEVGLPSAID